MNILSCFVFLRSCFAKFGWSKSNRKPSNVLNQESDMTQLLQRALWTSGLSRESGNWKTHCGSTMIVPKANDKGLSHVETESVNQYIALCNSEWKGTIQILHFHNILTYPGVRDSIILTIANISHPTFGASSNVPIPGHTCSPGTGFYSDVRCYIYSPTQDRPSPVYRSVRLEGQNLPK